MLNKIKYFLGLVAIMFVTIGISEVDIYASSDLVIYEPLTGEDTISVYVKGADDKKVSVQVGTSLAEIKSDQSITEPGNYVYTLILIDNSKSIKKTDRDRAKELISNLVMGRVSNEKIAIATLENNAIKYICDYTDDGLNLQNTFNSIEYEKHKAYIIDILYDLFLNNELIKEKNIFWRIIVVSDVNDHNGGKYTENELNKVLKEKKIPVYTVFCSEKTESDNIKWFTSISRETDAIDLNLINTTDFSSFVRRLQEDSDVRKIEFLPEPKLLDGMEKMVKINVGERSVSQLIFMPQKKLDIVIEKSDDEKVNEKNIENKDNKDIKDIEEEKPSDEVTFLEKYLVYIIGGIIIFILIAIISVVMIIMRRRKVLKPESNNVKKNKEFTTETFTNIMQKHDNSYGSQEQVENFVNNECVRMTCLTENWEKQFSIGDFIVVGRSLDKSGCVIDFDPTISREHCRIIRRSGKYFIENLSKNGTKINEKEIYKEEELVNGSMITLGHTKVRFEIVNNNPSETEMLFY